MFKSQLKTLSVIVFSSLIISQSYSAGDSKKLDVSESAFKCLSALAASGRFFVDNILGDLDATLAVANSKSGGNYPPGSLLTLVPDEAMIKHQQGWNPATNDWEFFLLDLSEEGTSILTRGGAEVASPSGSCFGCHQLARSEWDLVCGVDHGCAPIAFTLEQIRSAQSMDPRCTNENKDLRIKPASACIASRCSALRSVCGLSSVGSIVPPNNYSCQPHT